MSLQESMLRAAVGDMTAGHKRGTAYGIFNGIYGFGLLAGSAAMGALYGLSVGWLVAFVVAIELAATAAAIPLLRERPAAPRGT